MCGVQAVRSNCSIVDVYVSYTNPRPNPAIYSQQFTVSDGKPAYLTMEGQENGLPVYVTVVGSRLPNTSAELANCSDFTYEMKFEPMTREWKFMWFCWFLLVVVVVVHDS